MKTSKLFSAVCVAILLAAPVFVQAQNSRSPYGAPGTNAGPSRSFLGLPIPQQWSGNRPSTTNQYSGNAAYRSNDYNNPYPGQFANGQYAIGNRANGRCGTGNRTTGNCATGNCRNCKCPNGACASGLCASGQCPTCVNGQCAGCANGQCANVQCANGQDGSGQYGNGQNVSRNCPDGQCPLNQNSNARSNSYRGYSAQGNWSPRGTRSNSADPFRGAEDQDESDNWTQRPAVRNPVSDLYPSRYNQNDLDLRGSYFNNQSSERNDSRSGDNFSATRDTRAPRPSDRSMFGAPADRVQGMTQI